MLFWKKLLRKPKKHHNRAVEQTPCAKNEFNKLSASIFALSKQQEEMSMNIKYIANTLESLKQDSKQNSTQDLLEELAEDIRDYLSVDLTKSLKGEFAEIFENSTPKEDDSATKELINSLVALMDLIEDFHAFAASNDNSDLLSHAEVLMSSAAKKITSSGITPIRDVNTPPDPMLNTITAVEENDTFPDGHITKTLRGGYLYMGKIVRRSQVIVNKISHKETEDESENESENESNSRN